MATFLTLEVHGRLGCGHQLCPVRTRGPLSSPAPDGDLEGAGSEGHSLAWDQTVVPFSGCPSRASTSGTRAVPALPHGHIDVEAGLCTGTSDTESSKHQAVGPASLQCRGDLADSYAWLRRERHAATRKARKLHFKRKRSTEQQAWWPSRRQRGYERKACSAGDSDWSECWLPHVTEGTTRGTDEVAGQRICVFLPLSKRIHAVDSLTAVKGVVLTAVVCYGANREGTFPGADAASQGPRPGLPRFQNLSSECALSPGASPRNVITAAVSDRGVLAGLQVPELSGRSRGAVRRHDSPGRRPAVVSSTPAPRKHITVYMESWVPRDRLPASPVTPSYPVTCEHAVPYEQSVAGLRASGGHVGLAFRHGTGAGCPLSAANHSWSASTVLRCHPAQPQVPHSALVSPCSAVWRSVPRHRAQPCGSPSRVTVLSLADHLGCDPQTRFSVPPNIKQWIALLQRGNCTFKEKISRAAFHNAVAVVIYNNKSKEEPVTMTHPGQRVAGPRGAWTRRKPERLRKRVGSALEKNRALSVGEAMLQPCLLDTFCRTQHREATGVFTLHACLGGQAQTPY
ncbi:E3 ubiquitin-protein ligase RNF130 [Tupaia chinensis]|uniref:E3 ubiquitin-protein ligase RNF130 n=1 Tax=Tupaia chinensis TaxID=246437 RepID=L9KWK7_TUPCH|nr:E3 ubiquitin-protein ligase RNF130 [Tupaia chinensis]